MLTFNLKTMTTFNPFIIFPHLILFCLTYNYSYVQLFDYVYILFGAQFTLCECYCIIHLIFFFSTCNYVFKLHPYSFLYILFIASKYYIFIKLYLHHTLFIHSPNDGNLQLLAPK